MNINWITLLIFLLPLAGFAVLGLAGRFRLRMAAGRVASGIMAIATACALLTAYRYFFITHDIRHGTVAEVVWQYRWLTFDISHYIDMGIVLDGLSVMMVVLVCLVSLFVHVYSVAYLHDEERYTGYFAFLQLFTFSMLGLVVAINLFQIYFFWELVGVSSYLLIGFHYERPSAVKAAKKAFVVTRFADFGFLVGILIVGFTADTFDLFTLFDANCHADAAGASMFWGLPVITWGTLLMFMGGAGKSAMFPLHIWLPDAMEGPTPVSALIHAATMVVAGVFLVARLFPVYSVAPYTLEVVLLVGIASALFAACVAVTQTDVKRVLAYSTMSQIGLMMFGLGLAAHADAADEGYVGALFHLFTHGFFKALLFLAAGIVIHQVHSNEVGHMGGLRRVLPLTHVVFLLACLAIAGIPPFAGFYSKELLLHAAAHQGLLYAAALLVSALTAFYMFRLYFLIFWNKPASAASEPEFRASQWFWYGLPLLLLGLASVLAGLVPFGRFVTPDGLPRHFALDLSSVVAPLTASLAGILAAARMYLKLTDRPERLARGFGRLYTAAYRKFYIDDIYEYVTHRLVFKLFGRAAAWTDRRVVDGAVNGTGWLMQQVSAGIRFWQSGKLQHYAFWFFVGVAVFAVLLLNQKPG